MHPLLQPFLDQLNNIDKVLTSIPDGLPDPNVYQDPMADWCIEWFYDEFTGVSLFSMRDGVDWYSSTDGITTQGNFKYGSPFPSELTTAIKALQEKENG